MKELIIRSLIGGTLVSVFAFMGDIIRPKSFAGLFGADAARFILFARIKTSAEEAQHIRHN
jgi:hypothetical protein